MSKFTNEPFSVTKIEQEELYYDFDELRKEREKTDSEIIEWSKNI